MRPPVQVGVSADERNYPACVDAHMEDARNLKARAVLGYLARHPRQAPARTELPAETSVERPVGWPAQYPRGPQAALGRLGESCQIGLGHRLLRGRRGGQAA